MYRNEANYNSNKPHILKVRLTPYVKKEWGTINWTWLFWRKFWLFIVVAAWVTFSMIFSLISTWIETLDDIFFLFLQFLSDYRWKLLRQSWWFSPLNANLLTKTLSMIFSLIFTWIETLDEDFYFLQFLSDYRWKLLRLSRWFSPPLWDRLKPVNRFMHWKFFISNILNWEILMGFRKWSFQFLFICICLFLRG